MTTPNGHVPGDAAVMRVGPRITRDDVPGLCDRLIAFARDRHGSVVVCDVGAVAEPDAVTVEALARMQLTARRIGCDLRIRGVDRRLRMLIALVGLADALALGDQPFGGQKDADAGSGLEPRRQPEEREDPVGVEEVDDPGDPPV
ncbi:MAG TPA: STAS domain-containing protein [Asanoa sp.]